MLTLNIARLLAKTREVHAPPAVKTARDAPDTPLSLLRLLRDMGIALRLEGNRLYVDISAGNVTRAMLEALRQHQEVLLTILEWYEERAGLLEYDGGLSRVEAEREAWILVEERYGSRV